MIVGGVGNGAAEEDWCWDLNPGVAAIEGSPCGFGGEGRGSRRFGRVNRRGPLGFGGEEEGPCGFGVLHFATWLRQQEKLCREEKGRKDSCWCAVRRCHVALDLLEIVAATQLMVPGA